MSGEETKGAYTARPPSSSLNEGSVNMVCSQSIVDRDDPSDSREFMSTSVYNEFDSDIATMKSVAGDGEEKTFSFSGGLILSCLGCVLGTGNIWRFPRVLASTSSDGGSLTFILAWACFLFTWSIPLVVTEYTMGRFTRGSPLTSFYKFLGRKFLWVGAWVTSVAFFISAYFSVVVGWCFFYFYLACAQPMLPESPTESAEIFHWFTSTYYPLLTHTICLIICGVCVFWGVKGIEIANSCLVPLQLFIVLFTFAWSLTREYADVGIQFMFTPNWHTLADPKLYVEAACQNAFDTAAGMGLFSAYAAYFTRKTGAVRFGMFLPMINNLVSLVCGFMIFATVFSTLIATEPTLTIPQIVGIMKDTGPGSTGLTFTWIPVLMAKLGTFGRVLCGLFFLCLSFAGITSMISYIELTARTIQDFGVRRTYATIASLIVTFLVGVPSAIDLRALTNQDFVWGFALMISGLCYCFLVIRYKPMRYRKVIVNDFGIGDLKLHIPWVAVITVLVPIEAVGLIAWWAYESISQNPDWYKFTAESFIVIILEWIIVFVLLGVMNLIVYFRKNELFEKSPDIGFDPYHPERIPSREDWLTSREIPVVSQECILNSDPHIPLY
ncbi:hypothetical protein AAHC03_09723 [Spirometra sp. Aus1]|nr:unnamed protein product [Spirometra erinaceieuropaei]